MQDLSDALRRLALERGLNQVGLARFFGVSQPTISRLYRYSSVKRGPAYRQVAARLKGISLDQNEYSGIQETSIMFERHIKKLRPSSDAEADAIDKLLTAIEQYVAVRTGQQQ